LNGAVPAATGKSIMKRGDVRQHLSDFCFFDTLFSVSRFPLHRDSGRKWEPAFDGEEENRPPPGGRGVSFRSPACASLARIALVASAFYREGTRYVGLPMKTKTFRAPSMASLSVEIFPGDAGKEDGNFSKDERHLAKAQ